MKISPTIRYSLRQYWRFTRPYQAYFWASQTGAAMGILAQNIIPPFLVARSFAILQTSYARHEAVSLHALLPYLMGFLISMLIGLISWRLCSYCVWIFEGMAQRDMITAVFKHVEQQSQSFHANRFAGALVSQTNKFAGAYERLMDDFTFNIVPGVIGIGFSLALLCVVAPYYGLALIVIIIFYIAVMSKRVKHQFPFNKADATAESGQTAALADAITNTANIRAFGREDYEFKRFAGVATKRQTINRRLAIEAFKNDSISHSMTNTLRSSGFVFGVLAVTNWGANAGVLYLVVAYATGVVDSLWQFGRIVRNVNRSFGDATEMAEILQIEPDIKDPVEPESVRINRGSITFDEVRFRHSHKQDLLFDGLTLKIKPGEKIGLVGPSGGGKTTLTGLLLRFTDVESGTIAIDGQSISAITQADLRAHISYVPQEPMLFHRSLFENIRYGELDASKEAVEAVAKLAHAHDFITQLPEGYHTLVGERGVKLSGGQRQRIAIARAMLKNAPILVLDEATSALDSESEALIQDALWKLMDNRTAIVIAHRLSTIQKMDRILVLENGRIAEEGSHQELIRANGIYAKLWNHQSGGFLEG